MRVFTAFLAITSVAGAFPLALEQVSDIFSLEARADNAAAVLKAFAASLADNKKLDATVNSFPNNAKKISGSTQVKLLDESSAIKKDIKKGTSAASSSSAFSDSESKKIGDAVQGGKAPVFKTLDDIVAHKVAFDNSGSTKIVISQIKGIQGAVKDFGDAIAPKLTSKYQKKAPKVAKEYDAAFSAAIKKLS